MKKVLFLLCIILITISGCSNQKRSANNSSYFSDSSIINKNDNAKISSEYNFSNNGEVFNFLDTLNQPVKKEKNYTIYSNKDCTSYFYKIFNNDGICLDYGYYGWRSANFEQNGNILKIRFLYGGNIGNEKYYDIKNGKVSKIFERVLADSKDLIAYFSVSSDNPQQTVIVIENIFDSTKLHYEFPRYISDTSLLQHYVLDAEFIENNKKFKITYQRAGDYKEVTEILTLQ